MINFAVASSLAGFPPHLGLPGVAPLAFTDADLAHALFVTGRAPGDEALHGVSSYWEFLHRASLVPAYLRAAPNGRLGRSALALDLDRSEKVNLSYSVGQAMAAIFSTQVLGVVRLLHIDRYSQHHNIAFGQGQKRPDLFGQGAGGWVVVEAKGRSNGMEAGLPQKLQQQKQMVATIAGAPPWVAVGSVAEFPPPGQVLRLRAIDPPTKSAEAQDWPVDRDLFVGAYYEPFLRVISTGVPVRVPAERDSDRVQLVDLGPIGIQIGLLQPIADAVRELRSRRYKGLADTVDEILQGAESLEVRRDGSVVTTSWDESLTGRDVDT